MPQSKHAITGNKTLGVKAHLANSILAANARPSSTSLMWPANLGNLPKQTDQRRTPRMGKTINTGEKELHRPCFWNGRGCQSEGDEIERRREKERWKQEKAKSLISEHAFERAALACRSASRQTSVCALCSLQRHNFNCRARKRILHETWLTGFESA